MENMRPCRAAALSLALGLIAASGALAGTLTVRPGVPNVGGFARYTGNHGLEVNVASPNRNPAFVQTSHPASESTYRVRFYVNLAGLSMTNGDEFEVFSAYDGVDPVPPAASGNALLRAVVRETASESWLSVFVRLDNGTEMQIPSTVELAKGWRAVELNWVKATAAGANNGRLDLWVDGVARTGLSLLDNDVSGINYARWGTVSGVDAGTSGSFRLDDFASQRTGYIGLLSIFSDVQSSSPLWPFIQGLYAAEITSGCSPGLFCPNNVVTRDQMAVFLLVAKEGAGYSPPACVTQVFADVPCSSPFAPWVNELAARGVTSGCGGGNYCPATQVTRDQMAVFLLVTLEGSGYSPPACVTPSFSDVPCSSPFAKWVNEVAARGVTSGCGGSNYCPASAVTRGQMAVFLTTAFELPVQRSGP
jgi:hypothetical protein